MSDHPYGAFSLAPPLVAIVLAIATRRVVLSLFCGILSGVGIMAAHHPDAYAGGSLILLPVSAIGSTFRDHLWATLVQEEKLAVFAFTMLMGAMVGIIQHCGGMRGLVDSVSRWANNIRRAQIAAWLLGLIVFFDDYANTMLLGGTLRPLFDRLKISREKLAYLVDSTAAPVSGLALVSTWVAGEIGYVRDGLAQLEGVEWDPLQLFLGSIPYRFYVLLALLMVPLSAWMRRDFKSMAAAERQSRLREAPPEDLSPAANDDGGEPILSHWLNAVLPIAVTVGAIVVLLCQSGLASLSPDDQRTWMNIFGNADTFMSLVWGSLIGVFSAAGLALAQGLLSVEGVKSAAMAGAMHMTPALAVLWLASALSQMTSNDEPDHPLPAAAEAAAVVAQEPLQLAGNEPNEPSESQLMDDANRAKFSYQRQRLYTGDYLGGLLENRMPLWLAPTAVFVLSGAIAFATGTSWGTMGIIMPLAISAAYRLLAAESTPSAEDPILLGCVGSVLAGAIFGDHCSPISDTTVMSSQASGCSHVDHVRTQLPYALCVGLISIVFGTLPIAFGVSPWILLPLGIVAIVLSLVWFAEPSPE